MARLAPLAVLACAVALLAAPARGGGPTMTVGAAEDAVRTAGVVGAKAKMTLLQLAGIDTVRLDSTWLPGLIEPTAEERTILDGVDAAARLTGVKLIVHVVHADAASTPLTDEARAQFAQYVTALLTAYPGIGDVVVGNEPNLDRSWLPQFNPDRTTASPAAYLALLAAVYDAVKTAVPTVRVWGGALAPRGADRPGGARETLSPGRFLVDLGAAYRASGRTVPVMDGLAFHPYADSSAQSPDTPHAGPAAIGLADYEKLVSALATAFDGTAQPGTALPLLYDEFGVETAIPAAKASLYTGVEPATTKPVAERVQAAYYARALQLAFCQPNVVGLLIAHPQDERALGGRQSGILYADGKPKTSFWAVRDAIRRVRAGSVARCDGLELAVEATDLRVPTAAEVRAGLGTVELTCSLDCTWQLRMLRGSAQVALFRGYGLAGRPVRQLLPRRVATGAVSVELTLAAAVNPGPPTVLARPLPAR